jgi:hypothetical protein
MGVNPKYKKEKKMKKVRFFTVTILTMALILSCASRAAIVADNGATKISRKVVSYRMYGEEYANEIDHIELEWGHEKENWLSPGDEDYDDLQTDSTFSYLHTLKMTIYLKDGGTGTILFKGGFGDFGDTMKWNVSGSFWSVYSYYDGNYIWAIRNGRLLMPDIIEINPENLDFRFYKRGEKYLYPNNGKNIITFNWVIEDEDEDQSIFIELDGSFFP